VEPIRFSLTQGEKLLVVDGLITDKIELYSIRLSLSAKYENVIKNGYNEPVVDATVSVIVSDGDEFHFTEMESGNYISSGDFVGENSRSYQLKILLSNGNVYYSVPQTLVANSSFDSINNSKESREVLNERNNLILKEGMQINVDFSFDEKGSNYLFWAYSFKYQIRDQFVHINDNHNVIVTQSDNFSSNIINGHNLLFLEKPLGPEPRNYQGIVNQYSISKEVFDFWDMVSNQQNHNASIFDPSISKPVGNIYNANNPDEIVLGVFSAAGVNTKAIKFSM
jgi:hypothetical protein